MKKLIVPLLACLSMSAMASQIRLVNNDANNKPIKVTYQVGYYDQDQYLQLKNPQSIVLIGQKAINFDLLQNELGGVIITSINDVNIPHGQCSLGVTADSQDGTINIDFASGSDNHGMTSCAMTGGILD